MKVFSQIHNFFSSNFRIQQGQIMPGSAAGASAAGFRPRPAWLLRRSSAGFLEGQTKEKNETRKRQGQQTIVR